MLISQAKTFFSFFCCTNLKNLKITTTKKLTLLIDTLGATLLLSEATDSLITVRGRLEAGRIGAAITEAPLDVFDELLPVLVLRT
jgi:hypothetical protein